MVELWYTVWHMQKNISVVLDKDIFQVKGRVKLFPQEGGWFYVGVPKEHTEMTKDLADRGLVAIVANVGSSTWKTSLLPMGDGTHFIALPAKVRKKEKIDLGNSIKLSFTLRNR